MASINQSQAKLLAEDFLKNIGTSKENFKDLPVINSMLVEAAELFITNAQANLDKANAVDTGELSSTLTFSISSLDGRTILTVGYPKLSKGAEYYDYVNKGVVGTVSNQRGATGDYRFKTSYANKKMATMLLLWYRRNASKVRTSDAQSYTQKGIETKGKSLFDTVKKSNSLKSLAYATAINIKKKGLKATKFFDDAIYETFNDSLIKALSIALGVEVRLEIKKVTKR